MIAESLEDGKRMPVYQSYNVSTLGDISIYTTEGEVSLKEVFIKVYEKENSAECAAAKAKDAEIKTYFESILPDYDKEKVYVSDIKKLLKWYNQLVKGNHMTLEDLKKEEEVTTEEEVDKKEAKAEDGTEKKVVKKDKTDEPKKKKVVAKTKTAAPKVKNAPAKKVQTVRKAGG